MPKRAASAPLEVTCKKTRLDGDESASSESANPQGSFIPPRRLSSIKKLPTEVLEIIFVSSRSGNLLRASPLLAARLSGSQLLYKAFYLTAFYGKINEQRRTFFPAVRVYFGLQHLILNGLPDPTSQELRNMMLTCLKARWLTIELVLEFGKELWKMGIDYIFQDLSYNPGWVKGDKQQPILDQVMPLPIHLFHERSLTGVPIEIKSGGFTFYQSSPFAWATVKDTHGKYDHIMRRHKTPHPISLDCPAKAYLERAVRIHARTIFDDHERFKPRLKGRVWSCLVSHLSQQIDAKARIENALHQITADIMESIRLGDGLRLSEQLSAYYLLHPEGEPFILPHTFFEAATAADSPRVDVDVDDTLLVLFEVDPYSLPRIHAQTRQWISRANLIDKEQKVNRKLERHEFRRANAATPGGLSIDDPGCWEFHQRVQEAYIDRRFRDRLNRLLKYMHDTDTVERNIEYVTMSPELEYQGVIREDFPPVDAHEILDWSDSEWNDSDLDPMPGAEPGEDDDEDHDEDGDGHGGGGTVVDNPGVIDDADDCVDDDTIILGSEGVIDPNDADADAGDNAGVNP